MALMRRNRSRSTSSEGKEDSPEDEEQDRVPILRVKQRTEYPRYIRRSRPFWDRRINVYSAKRNTADMGDRDIITLGHRDIIILECRIDTFGFMLNSCETIIEILTLCGRDFPNIPVLDQELRDVVSAKSVQVYTTETFRHHFASGSNERTRNILLQDIKHDIKHFNKFALVVVDKYLHAAVINFLKDSDIRTTGLLLVGNILNILDHHKILVIKTQPNELMENADCLLEMCAFSLLKLIRLSVQQYEEHSSGRKTAELVDLIDTIVSIYERSFNFSSSNKD